MFTVSRSALIIAIVSGVFSRDEPAQSTSEARLATEVQPAVASLTSPPTLSAWTALHTRERIDFPHYETNRDRYEVDFANQWCVTSLSEAPAGITRAASFYVPEVRLGVMPALPTERVAGLTASCRLGALWYEISGRNAAAHLLPVERVHGGIGVDGNDLQFYVGRFPDPFPHDPHNGQNLPGDIAMQCVDESPAGRLHRQFGDLENARQDRIAGDEAQLVQSWKADVEAEHDASTNRYKSMARGIRLEVTVCSTSDWNPSFSSMVITGVARRKASDSCHGSHRAWKH